MKSNDITTIVVDNPWTDRTCCVTIDDDLILVGMRKAMPTKAKDYRIRRQHAKVAVQNPELRHAVLVRDGHRCVDCGRGDDLVLHHIKAVYYGGETVIINLQTLCKPCNYAKPLEG